MQSRLVVWRRSDAWAVFWATLAIVALIMAMVSLPTSSAQAATGNDGFVLTTAPGSQSGSGVATVTRTFDLGSVAVQAVITNGKFLDGRTVIPFNLQGPKNGPAFQSDYCAGPGGEVSVTDLGGNVYQTKPAVVAAGTCGEVTPPTPTPTPSPTPTETATPSPTPIVTSLPPEVILTGTKNATKDKDGTATFNVTNPNQVGITYQVHVNGALDQSLTVPKGQTVPLVINLPSGDYKLTLRAAGLVTNPISFTICQDEVVVTPPTVKPTPTPTPVATPSPKPTVKPTPQPTVKPTVKPTPSMSPSPRPSSHPVVTPAPTKVAPQPVATKAPTKAVIVVKQQPTKSATAKRINGVNFDTAAHDTTPTSSFVWFGVLAFALLGLVLCAPFRKKGRRA